MKRLLLLVTVLLPALAVADMPYEKTPCWQSTETGVYSTGLFWHDVDLDGWLDMFIANGNDMSKSPEYVYRNNNGTLPTTHTWAGAVNDYSGHCAVGDIDYDGYPEFFVSNYIGTGWVSTNSVMYKNNSGTLGTSPAWISADLFHSFACDLGDPDGDGDLDIAFACGEGYGAVAQAQRIYFNVGGTINDDTTWFSLEASYMLDVGWADVDLDGDLDLAFACDGGKSWLFYNDNGVLELTPSWRSDDSEHSNTLAWGDWDGDGYLELAVADNDQTGGSGRFKVYRNNNGTLSTMPVWQSGTGGYGSAVCWFDYDRDGDNDLAAGRWWGAVYIYENTGGTLTTSPVWVSATSTVVEEIRVCDVDKDGVESYHLVNCGNRKVFYVDHYPMHWLDSVLVGGIKLTLSEYCFDLNSGWVSLAVAPTGLVDVFYQYSDKQDITVSNWDGANLVFADTLSHTAPPPRGDCDGNGFVNIADVVYTISYIFAGGPPPEPLGIGDVNCDCLVNVADVVYMIAYTFAGGPPPCS